MKALLRVLCNGRSQTLCFASKDDASRFADFVGVYMDDSGAGNEYGAYWLTGEEILETRRVPKDATCKLDRDLIETMVYSILRARLAQNDPRPTTAFQYKVDGDGAVMFDLDLLPSRLRPTAGDLYRIPRSKIREEWWEQEVPREGRVIEDHGDWFSVVSFMQENKDGSLKPDAPVHSIPADSVMKINDYVAEIRGRTQ